MMNARQTEKGQALVLIILSIVAIFGFAALAVDFGRIYSERRRAQNAADAAALAAASAYTTNEDWEYAAVNVAEINGFIDNGETTTVTISNPPESGAYGPDSGYPKSLRDEYYQVIITQHVDPVFGQFVFGGDESVRVEAVSRATFNTNVSAGNAVHSLDEGDKSMIFDGTVDVEITGGNIVSNGDGTKEGGSGTIRVTNGGEINISGDWVCNGCDETNADIDKRTVLPQPNEDITPQMIENVPPPDCPAKGASDYVYYDDAHDVNYYVYKNGLHSGELEPGIHCVYGDTKLAGQDTLTGTNVLIVFIDGDFEVTGSPKIELSCARDIKDQKGRQYGGMLIYVPKTNVPKTSASVFKLGGNSDALFNGTILAPTYTCDIGGTPDVQANHTSLICNKVKFHGDSGVRIVYTQGELYRFPPRVDLAQ